MLTCRACLRRWLAPLDAPANEPLRTRRYLNSAYARAPQRLFSSSSIARLSKSTSTRFSQVQILQRNGLAQKEWGKTSRPPPGNPRKTPGVAFSAPNLARIGRRDPSVSVSEWERRKKELQHLQDPLALAEFVRKELYKGKTQEMLLLVRMASNSMQCVVSWNHIIDKLLADKKVNEAMKVYNDMKKRAQFPDAHTYTIVLRGLSTNAQTSGVLTKALSVYHSLYADNSRVEASIIHTNAALRVCSRALDMDALWGIAGKIPENGPAAANKLTYVTILNTLRMSVLVNAPLGESADQAAIRKDQAVMQGRRMWEDIIGRWRRADLAIDEELVCAMGRLLLVGSRPRDWDDVLSLVEQTMDVPRLVPRLGTQAREEAGLPKLRAPGVSENFRFDDDHLGPGKPPTRGDEFLVVSNGGVKGIISSPLSYAKPGNNTLSLLLESCQRIMAKKAGQEYWDMLTDTAVYNIEPDLNNVTMRLRNLRQNRASAAAVQMLQEDIINKGLQPRPGTFRIVMSTCVRDKNNHHSLEHAGEILTTMLRTLEDVDAKTATMYAELAIAYPLAKASDLIGALTLLHPVVQSLRLQLSVGGEDYGNEGVGAAALTKEERSDAIVALRKVYGVYDKLLFSDMLVEEQKAPFKAEKARLAAYLHRVSFKDASRERKKPQRSPTRAENSDSIRSPQPEEFEAHGYLSSEAADYAETQTKQSKSS